MPRPREDPDAPVRTYRVPPVPERVVHYPGMAKEAMKRITAALAGQLPVAALIAWCDEAEDRWPLVGWREAGEALRRRPAPRPGAGLVTRGRRPAAVPWDRVGSQQRSREELERQKAEVARLAEEEVPF